MISNIPTNSEEILDGSLWYEHLDPIDLIAYDTRWKTHVLYLAECGFSYGDDSFLHGMDEIAYLYE